jgi:hypothetical protein
MAVKVRDYNLNGIEQPEWTEKTFDQREVTFDNMTFAYGTNQTRNFADDGVGIGFTKSGQNIVQDTIPFGNSRS